MGPISCMVCSNFMSIKELIKQFYTMSITSSFSTPQQDIHVNLYSSRITVTVVCTRRRTFFFKFCEIFLFVWPCISFGIDLLPFGSILLTCISGLLFYYYALIISRRMVIGGFFTKAKSFDISQHFLSYRWLIYVKIHTRGHPGVLTIPYSPTTAGCKRYKLNGVHFRVWFVVAKHISSIFLNRTSWQSIAQNLGKMETCWWWNILLPPV